MVTHSAPREHLPGDAAGGRPGWQARVVDKVIDDQRARRAKQRVSNKWPGRLLIVSDPQLNILVGRAAAARGMSMTGYARRAVCAFLASDLGMDFTDVCSLVPKPSPTGQSAWGRLPGKAHPQKNPGRWVDDGEGYGDWKVCP